MKYFHVIYNSSEKGIDGGRGFCFRTYTQDTPSAYLNALQENELLGYAQGNCESVMPQTLKSDPESIQSYPSSYFFRELVAEGGKHIYALGRTIPVGFDYTFYMKYIPGRMGNYVVDCYLFECRRPMSSRSYTRTLPRDRTASCRRILRRRNPTRR